MTDCGWPPSEHRNVTTNDAIAGLHEGDELRECVLGLQSCTGTVTERCLVS